MFFLSTSTIRFDFFFSSFLIFDNSLCVGLVDPLKQLFFSKEESNLYMEYCDARRFRTCHIQ